MKYNTKDITCVISTNRICSLSDIYEKRLSNDGDINKLVDRLKNQDYELIKKRAIEICNSFLKNNKLLELNNDILQSHLFSCLRDNSFNRKENIDLEYDLYNYKPRNIPVYDKINELDLKVITTIISQYDSLNELLKKDDVNSNIIFYFF